MPQIWSCKQNNSFANWLVIKFKRWYLKEEFFMDGKIKVTKIGNKLGFVLPEEIAQKMKISENEEVEYKLVGRRIVLEPSDETGSLAQMFREHPDDYDTDTELVDKGGAVGDELY